MKDKFRITKGSVIGREHVRLWRNNQDAVSVGGVTVGEKEYVYGVVTDGCSEGKHSEVGAKLLVEWMQSEIPMILSTGVGIEDALSALYQKAIDYLAGIARATAVGPPEQIVEFIRNYLLSTVLGFLMDDEMCCVFAAGDGLVAINDDVVRIDQGNKPVYLGYHLVPRVYLQDASGLPKGFQLWKMGTASIVRMAVCTDGMEEDLLDRVWEKDSDVQLTRELKRMSRAEGRLSDDCSVIVAERFR